jgi:hypothetical protein
MGDPAAEEATAEPCFECPCCALWAESLQVLRDQIARHVAGELRLAPCHPDCLLCAEVEWQSPAVPDDAARADLRAQLAAGVEPDRVPGWVNPPRRRRRLLRWWRRRG